MSKEAIISLEMHDSLILYKGQVVKEEDLLAMINIPVTVVMRVPGGWTYNAGNFNNSLKDITITASVFVSGSPYHIV